MINLNGTSLTKCIIHKVGNKYLDNSLKYSKTELLLTEELNVELKNYFIKPFRDNQQLFQFFHNIELKMNEVYTCCDNIFDDEDFVQNSINIVQHLFDETKHPSIKPGEVFIALFDEAIIDNVICKAIGIFKSERKDNFFKIDEKGSELSILIENGISQAKLDKGCIILNNNYHDGFDVLAYEHNNNDAVYWKDDFLQLKIRNDSFNQTSNTLGIYKNFVTQKLDDEFEISKADKIDLLNKSMKYFKEKDTFDLDEFAGEVIGNEKAIESFKTFKSQYEQEFETPIADTFEISGNAVKKQQRVYKSVLKLDKNFHIYIHGDKELIEKGFDDSKHMNYYKVYFKEEA
jgi:hypothetical protein